MKIKLTALAFLLLPTISTPTFADLTLTAGEFVQNTDGTVTHTPTGLIWQACSAGQTFEPSFGTCLGEAKTFQWQDDNDEKNSAINMTSDFAGQTDWRIPNLAELRSLVDLKKYQPTVNKSLFPQTPTGNYFLSSSTYTQSSSYQWAINFGQGSNTHASYGYVRFVRGATVSFVISLKENSALQQNNNITFVRIEASPGNEHDKLMAYAEAVGQRQMIHADHKSIFPFSQIVG